MQHQYVCMRGRLRTRRIVKHVKACESLKNLQPYKTNQNYSNLCHLCLFHLQTISSRRLCLREGGAQLIKLPSQTPAIGWSRASRGIPGHPGATFRNKHRWICMALVPKGGTMRYFKDLQRPKAANLALNLFDNPWSKIHRVPLPGTSKHHYHWPDLSDVFAEHGLDIVRFEAFQVLFWERKVCKQISTKISCYIVYSR
jgi:hypothetical protein